MQVPCSQGSRGTRRRAFTITELLVAVAIIAILSVLAINALRPASAAAQRTACLSQMRQLGGAFQLYFAENQNRFPGFGINSVSRWHHQLAVYLGHDRDAVMIDNFPRPVFLNAYALKELHCPLTPFEAYQSSNGRGNSNGMYAISPDLIAHAITGSREFGVSRFNVVNPATKVLIAERSYLSYEGIGTGGPSVSKSAPFPLDPGGAAANHRPDRMPQNGPDGPSNYLFVDGHVESLDTWPGREAFEPLP